ncbi:Prkg1 [Symbiodinium natans]|uniref:Prkg1 protein n=1 Tax=Symbiodinium natans TaxID=878477 RepID=A0A812SQX8_9DINO|nr:Prkg1 [Symbiodinium natans]
MGTTACSVSRRLDGKECQPCGAQDCRAALERDFTTDCMHPGLAQDTSAQRLQFLAKVKLFQRLPVEQHSVLASACKVVKFNDEVIIHQGEEGDELFVIQEGEAEVLLGDKPVILRAGDYFGETALLRDATGRDGPGEGATPGAMSDCCQDPQVWWRATGDEVLGPKGTMWPERA